ncbi:MAG: hypothetical protein PHF84_11605 [bacterium]|nr:hypothetical protein [bacterium]
MPNKLFSYQSQRLEDLREFGVVIDTWDDVFSDFDPRPLNERTVSGDFTDELKKRYRESDVKNFVISIYAPGELKNEESEKMVTQRLKRHFRYLYMTARRSIQQVRIRGLVFFLIGLCSLSFLTLSTVYKLFNALTYQLLEILLLPLGWFGFWEGLSKLVDSLPIFKQEELLMDKLSRATYNFKYVTHEEKKEVKPPASASAPVPVPEKGK